MAQLTWKRSACPYDCPDGCGLLVETDGDCPRWGYDTTTALRAGAIRGVVGELQFDVLKFRLQSEYGADVSLDRVPAHGIRWVSGPEADVAKFAEEYAMDCMMDKERNLVCLFPNEYRLNLAIKNYENLTFAATSQG